MIRPLVFTSFEGGIATDMKEGIRNSAAYIQSLDFRKSPSQMSVLPGPVHEDGGVLKDLPVNGVVTPGDAIYLAGNAGWIYKRSSAGAYSVVGNIGSNGGYGLDYRRDADNMYISGTKSVSLLSTVSTAPNLQPGYFGASFSTYNNTSNAGFNVAAYQGGSSATLTPKTSIAESKDQLRYFQSDIEPLSKISVFIVNPGSGNWTVTLHDGLNNVLATKTISNGSLKANDWNDFEFSSQVRIYVQPNARTYHIHVTSTVADGTMACSTANDMSTADLKVWADRLVDTVNDFHPIERFLQYECIGNGNYLSTWEPLSDPPTNDEWKRHALVFPQEYEVCGLAVLNEYLAIACERVPSSGGYSQGGIIFWWDGLSPTYNYFTRIPEGAPYGLREYQNIVYYYAGGAEYAIAGANSVPQKVRTLPGTDTEFSGANASVSVYPYTSTTRRGIHLIGFPSATTDPSINYGVYSWGAVDKNYPQSFGYSYLSSSGAKNNSGGNNLTLGMVKNFGDLLLTSWRDDANGGYRMDRVDNTNNPASYATWESLIVDNGYPGKIKTAAFMEAYFDLPEGATIKLKYKLNREDNWNYSPAYSLENLWQGRGHYARFSMTQNNGGDFYEAQVGVDITCDGTVTTPPVVQMVSFVYDDKREQALI